LYTYFNHSGPSTPIVAKYAMAFFTFSASSVSHILDPSIHQLEVADVECWSEGVEELGLVCERVGICVRSPGWNYNVVACFGVEMLAVLCMETNGALGDEKGLIVLVWESALTRRTRNITLPSHASALEDLRCLPVW
jgi:hypothetical protein